MKKIKLFSGYYSYINDLEKSVNEWMEDHKQYEIISSHTTISEEKVMITVFYEEKSQYKTQYRLDS